MAARVKRSVLDAGIVTTLDASFSHGLAGVNQQANYLFVNILLFTFVALCLLTLLYRLSRKASAHVRHISTLGASNQAYWSYNTSAWWPALKRHLSYAPLWKVRHNREIQLSAAVNVGTLPSRFHTILLLVYLASNLAYCLVLDYSLSDRAVIVAQLRGRTGVLAAINMIPTVLFALRNNPLIGLLQVSYDTFNLLHRWTARVMIVEALVHTSAWLANTLNTVADNQSAHRWTHVANVLSTTPSYIWASVATGSFILIAIQACSPVRHAFYETFLNGHRLLVLAVVVGVYFHIDLHRLPQLFYIQIVAVLWLAEYAFRLGRIVYLNVGARRLTRVTVEALPSEACRLTFHLARPYTFRPGCHVHAYIPALSWWSSHPFSVAWSSHSPASQLSSAYLTTAASTASATSNATAPSASTNIKTGVGVAISTTKAAEAGGDDSVALMSARASDSQSSVSLVVRARTGMTRALYERALRSTNGIFHTRGLVEGPYGGHQSLHSYGTVVLFAGGVGITHQVPHVRDLVTGFAAGTVAAKRIVLVWSVASTDALEWVRPWMDEVLRMPARRDCLRILLFVTKPKRQAEIVSGTGTVQMFPGRCDPLTVLDREIANRVGAMAVTVCGPGAFADNVRAAVRQRLDVGTIDFIEEAFTY